MTTDSRKSSIFSAGGTILLDEVTTVSPEAETRFSSLYASTYSPDKSIDLRKPSRDPLGVVVPTRERRRWYFNAFPDKASVPFCSTLFFALRTPFFLPFASSSVAEECDVRDTDSSSFSGSVSVTGSSASDSVLV